MWTTDGGRSGDRSSRTVIARPSHDAASARSPRNSRGRISVATSSTSEREKARAVLFSWLGRAARGTSPPSPRMGSVGRLVPRPMGLFENPTYTAAPLTGSGGANPPRRWTQATVDPLDDVQERDSVATGVGNSCSALTRDLERVGGPRRNEHARPTGADGTTPIAPVFRIEVEAHPGGH